MAILVSGGDISQLTVKEGKDNNQRLQLGTGKIHTNPLDNPPQIPTDGQVLHEGDRQLRSSDNPRRRG